MPELVAFFHSMIGLAAVSSRSPRWPSRTPSASPRKGEPIPTGNRLELFLGAAIGAITFCGSVIAFGKLSGKYKFRLFQGAPVQFERPAHAEPGAGPGDDRPRPGLHRSPELGAFFAMLRCSAS